MTELIVPKEIWEIIKSYIRNNDFIWLIGHNYYDDYGTYCNNCNDNGYNGYEYILPNKLCKNKDEIINYLISEFENCGNNKKQLCKAIYKIDPKSGDIIDYSTLYIYYNMSFDDKTILNFENRKDCYKGKFNNSFIYICSSLFEENNI